MSLAWRRATVGSEKIVGEGGKGGNSRALKDRTEEEENKHRDDDGDARSLWSESRAARRMRF